MPSYDKKLYQDVGEIKGMLKSMSTQFGDIKERVVRIENNQLDLNKKVARNSAVCSTLMAAVTTVVIEKAKTMFGLS